jgi:hypothetical protein
MPSISNFADQMSDGCVFQYATVAAQATNTF